MWCLTSGEYATLQDPKLDCFHVPRALCRPFATVYESDTRSSMTSRYLLRQALTHSHRYHSTSRCFNCSKLFYEVLRHSFASIPSPTHYCRCRSSGIRHRQNSCINCQSTRRRHLCRCLSLSKQHFQLFHCRFYFCQPPRRRSQFEH
jgi:hypothetical protein